MADREKIDQATVFADAGATRIGATFVQRAGLGLAVGVGSLITVVTLSVIIFFYTHYPAPPPPEIYKQAPADAKIVLEQYKELSEITSKSARELFEVVVLQALLPVFTGILGYIFGRSSKQGTD